MFIGIVCVVLLPLMGLVSGHGRMVEPAARNVMWRFGYKNNRNYNDMGLNCGGFPNQFEKHHGRCGVCGDPYQGPREHEAGGKYARGLVVRQYPGNAIINITVELTSNHMGYFEFRLCPVNDPHKQATYACLDRFLLNIIGHGTRFFIRRREMSINVDLAVMLPPGLVCTQCVLQWKYVAGQSMGPDGKGGECMGCGNQENFINCADIAIGKNKVSPLPMASAGANAPAIVDAAAKDWRELSVVPLDAKTAGKTIHGTNVPSKNQNTYAAYNAPTTVGYGTKPAFSNNNNNNNNNNVDSYIATTTMSWYNDPNVNYNKMNDYMNAQNTLYAGTPQPWGGNANKWQQPQTIKHQGPAKATSKPIDMQQKMQLMQQMFPTLMENYEWPAAEQQQQQQQQQHQNNYQNQNNGENGHEPGEYPEVPDHTPSSQSSGSSSHQGQNGAFQDPSYTRGFNDAMKHLKETFGLPLGATSTMTRGNVKIGTSAITSAVSEAQKVIPTSYTCPDGVSKPTCKAVNSWTGNPQFDAWCAQTCTTGDCPSNFCQCSCPGVQNWTSGAKCHSVDRSKAANMDRWCVLNCERGNCPENLCYCV